MEWSSQAQRCVTDDRLGAGTPRPHLDSALLHDCQHGAPSYPQPLATSRLLRSTRGVVTRAAHFDHDHWRGDFLVRQVQSMMSPPRAGGAGPCYRVEVDEAGHPRLAAPPPRTREQPADAARPGLVHPAPAHPRTRGAKHGRGASDEGSGVLTTTSPPHSRATSVTERADPLTVASSRSWSRRVSRCPGPICTLRVTSVAGTASSPQANRRLRHRTSRPPGRPRVA